MIQSKHIKPIKIKGKQQNSETKKTHQTNKNKRTNNTTVKQSKHIKPIKTKGLTTQQ